MFRTIIATAVLALALDASAGTGRIIILNSDKPGEGLNDPTPATPVGGNKGTTLGEQRMNVFLAAAERWQRELDTNVDIRVSATFTPIREPACNASGGVLGQAGTSTVVRDFTGAPRSNTWYPIALANKLAGIDLAPSQNDIFARFNADVDNNTCLGSTKWYYGLDANHGTDIDLFVVVLHELAHGLGMSGATTSPGFRDNRPAVFNTHMLDLTLGLRWDQMSDAQRDISLLNTGNLVWQGETVRANASQFLEPVTMLTISAPAPVAKNYDIGTASFGPSAASTALSGSIVQMLDAVNTEGPTTTDGCTTLTNAAQVAGKLALVDRGTCTFVTKALNAQAAGALGLIVVDGGPNESTTCLPPPMGGEDAAVTIPVISISKRDGNSIRTQLDANVTVSATLQVDPIQLAGASKEGYVRLYAPCKDEPGSSTYHWDSVASPSLLMEPSINSDLTHGVDLSLHQLVDIGWTTPQGRRKLRR
jgi:hypothetical protein